MFKNISKLKKDSKKFKNQNKILRQQYTKYKHLYYDSKSHEETLEYIINRLMDKISNTTPCIKTQE